MSTAVLLSRSRCPAAIATAADSTMMPRPPTWINATTPYVYQGAKLRDDAPASAVIAYSKAPNPSGTLSLLFADGHVEELPPAQAHPKIALTGK